jgi:hypothetical protein
LYHLNADSVVPLYPILLIFLLYHPALNHPFYLILLLYHLNADSVIPLYPILLLYHPVINHPHY